MEKPVNQKRSAHLGEPEPAFWANPFSFVFFFWYNRVLLQGWRKPLEMEDLPRLNPPLFTERCHSAFVVAWERRTEKLKASQSGLRTLEACRNGKNAMLLFTVLFTSCFWLLFSSVAMHLVATGTTFAFPLLLQHITAYLTTCDEALRTDAYIYALLNFVFPFLGGLLLVHANRLAVLAQVKITAALIAELFRKATRMSIEAQQSIEKGKIINLMSADIENVNTFIHPAMGGLLVLPLTIIVAIVLLYQQIGWTTFVGLGVLIIAAPVTGVFVGIMTQQREDMLAYTDKRIVLVNQLLAGIKALKTYAWEAAQEARIREQRRREVGRLGAMIPYYTGTVALMVASPIMASVASFCVYARVVPAEQFSPGRIFSSLALFGLLKPALEGLPFVLVELGAAVISLKRLTMFLMLQDRSTEEAEPFPGGGKGLAVRGGEFAYIKPSGPIIQFDDDEEEAARKHREEKQAGGGADAKAAAKEEKARAKQEKARAKEEKRASKAARTGAATNGGAAIPDALGTKADGAPDGGIDAGGAKPHAAAQDDAPMFALHDVNVSVASGELVCVVGRVGSGKTSLVSALLGDMTKTGGSVLRTGSLAYVAQAAWIVNASVRGNITFGKDFDQARYDEVVEACSLAHDFKILPAGDSTEIGEKGVNLSGGQKQRIAIARAVYADADIYVLDDPLSAVDVHVGAHIFRNVLQGMLAKKARLLVTNQLQYTREASAVVYLEDGRVAAAGPYDQVVLNERFADMLREYEATGAEDEGGDEGAPEGDLSKERASLMRATSQGGSQAIEAEWLRMRNEQMSMRMRSSLAGGLGGARGYGDVAMLSRANTQVFRDVPTEEELFADDDAGPSTPLMRRGTNLPEGDEGFGATLRSLFSSNAPSDRHSRPRERASGASLRVLLSRSSTRGADLLGSARSSRGRRASMLRHGGSSQLRGGAASQLAPAAGSQLAPGGVSQGGPAGSLRCGLSARMAADRFVLPAVKAADTQAPISPFQDPAADAPVAQAPPQKAPLAAPAAAPASAAAKPPLPAGKATRTGGKGDGPVHDGSLMTEEERDEGKVNWRVYWAYIRDGGVALSVLTVLSVCGGEAMSQLQQVWLQRWTGEAHDVDCRNGVELEPAANAAEPALDMSFLPGYIGFAAGYTGGLSLATALLAVVGLRASIKLHNNTLRAIVNAPMSFFDTTPAGRILNRFARDISDIDNIVPNVIFSLLIAATSLLALGGLITALQPYFLVGAANDMVYSTFSSSALSLWAGQAPMLVVYVLIHMFYTRSYIELQRVDAITRSPIYSHFGESLAGMDTVRAYGYERRFALESDEHVNYNNRAFNAMHTADQWLALALDTIGALLSFLVSMLVVGLKGQLGASKSALVLERTGELTQLLQVIVTCAAMMENKFNAVERMLEYQRVPQERAREVPEHKPPPEWPSEGVVEYRDVWLRYRERLPPVLKGVSFVVGSGEKVGIVGRTGSGKSSLIVALFRLAEPHQGAITLDGFNLLDMGLQDVRGRIAAIPQEPILFSGTIRSNVDPYDQHEDHEIWTALKRVDLKAVVGAQGEGLQSRVVESGENWSVGQRQLLCVARALLRKPKVLVLDEATASVDGETDAFIQRAIRANCAETTILTIAHRLNTIMDSTRVLVMHGGNKLEYDTVPALLARRDGAFRAMVLGAGVSHEALGSISKDREAPANGA